MLFGHQNDDANQATQASTDPQATGVNPLAVDPVTGASLPTAPPTAPTPPSEPEEPSMLNQPAPATLPFPPAPEPSTEAAETVADRPALDLPQPVASPAPSTEPETPTPTDPASDDLLSIKQNALEQLGPLVDHLDQTPEEKFRTTMMLIQSTDNPSRLQAAYDAAQTITDEKVRAQALLDVINEINYFTQKGSN